MKKITITLDDETEEIIRTSAYVLNMRESEVIELIISKMLENAKKQR